MTFSRLHIMALLGIAFIIWTLISIFNGTLVIFEHFPLAPLQDWDRHFRVSGRDGRRFDRFQMARPAVRNRALLGGNAFHLISLHNAQAKLRALRAFARWSSSPGQRAYRSNVPPISAAIAGERSTSPIERALSVRNTHPALTESPWKTPVEVIHRISGG
jgi:hypothetical protein